MLVSQIRAYYFVSATPNLSIYHLGLGIVLGAAVRRLWVAGVGGGMTGANWEGRG